MTATERYARNFAKVAYHSDSLDALDHTDRKQIARIFDTFKAEYHEVIANYPLWIAQSENITPRDRRRIAESYRKGEWPIFLFSHARIESYLRTLHDPQKAS